MRCVLVRPSLCHNDHAKLDDCYAIVSDLPVEVADAQTMHDRYKDLAKMEEELDEMTKLCVTELNETTTGHTVARLLSLRHGPVTLRRTNCFGATCGKV